MAPGPSVKLPAAAVGAPQLALADACPAHGPSKRQLETRLGGLGGGGGGFGGGLHAAVNPTHGVNQEYVPHTGSTSSGLTVQRLQLLAAATVAATAASAAPHTAPLPLLMLPEIPGTDAVVTWPMGGGDGGLRAAQHAVQMGGLRPGD